MRLGSLTATGAYAGTPVSNLAASLGLHTAGDSRRACTALAHTAYPTVSELGVVTSSKPQDSGDLGQQLTRPRGGGAETAHFDVLLRYAEHMFKAPVVIVIPRSFSASLDEVDSLRILLLRLRFNFWLSHQPQQHWTLVATMLVCMCRSQDANFLTSWLSARIKRMSLFAHGRFLTLLFFFAYAALRICGPAYGVVGLRIRVAGKISVVGNARKRAILFKKGQTSLSNANTRVSQSFYLIRTRTGCLGLTVHLFSAL